MKNNCNRNLDHPYNIQSTTKQYHSNISINFELEELYRIELNVEAQIEFFHVKI